MSKKKKKGKSKSAYFGVPTVKTFKVAKFGSDGLPDVLNEVKNPPKPSNN